MTRALSILDLIKVTDDSSTFNLIEVTDDSSTINFVELRIKVVNMSSHQIGTVGDEA